MFGKKKKQPKDADTNKQSAKELTNAKVQVMPDAFYGGKDPVIFESRTKSKPRSTPKPTLTPTTTKRPAPSPPSSPPGKTMQKPAAPVAPKPPAAPPRSSSKKWLILIVLILIGAVIGGIIWWFTRSEPIATTSPETIPFTEPEPTVPTPTVPTPPPPTTTPTTTEPEPTVPEIGGIVFPQIISIDSSDVDEDSLTDEEERIFGTDPTIWDSDEDAYYDGQEIYNLYNPRGEAPVRLIDSGLVRDFTNPQWRYRIFYPVNWEIGRVDTEGRQVLFSSITGEFVELRVFEKSPTITFQEWFGQTISGQSFSDIEPFENRFDVNGYMRRDSLVAYYPNDTEVVVMVYNVPESITEIRYRNIMRMMVQSFRPGTLGGTTQEDSAPEPPAEIIEAAEETNTTTQQESEVPSTTTPEQSQEPPAQTAPGTGIPGIDPNA